MRRLLSLTLTLLLAFTSLVPLLSAPARAQTGIGVLPAAQGQGDEVEKLLYEVVSRLPGITGIWAPTPSFDALLSSLAKARDEGRKIDLLVIGAHGNETALASNSPGLGFSDQDLVPDDIDMAAMRRERDRLLERLLDVSRRPNPKQCERWKELRDRLQRLESVADAFSPGARVLLVNCGAAGTPAGVKFVENLGAIFLGRNGGAITASKISVDLAPDNALNRARFWKDSRGGGQLFSVGPYFFAGDFADFPIAANTLGPRTFAKDLLGSVSVRVIDAETGQTIPGATATLTADGQSVISGTGPANGDPLGLRAPAVLAGAPMNDSVERGTDPTALRRYEARVEMKGYIAETTAVAFPPDSDLDNDCQRVKPTEVVIRLKPDPAARNPGGSVYLELVEVFPDKNTFEGSTVDPSGGSIIYDLPCCGRNEGRWDPPPKRIEVGDHVYPMGIRITATSLPKNTMAAGITVKLFAGLGLVDSAPTSVEVVSRDAQTATASSRFAFRPPTELAAWPIGAEAWILVEAGGRTVYYHYKVAR